jgi:hypothetical protein
MDKKAKPTPEITKAEFFKVLKKVSQKTNNGGTIGKHKQK